MANTEHKNFIASVLREHFDLEAASIDKLGRQHDDVGYVVDLSSPTRETLFSKSDGVGSSNFGTTAIPPQTKRLVVRMPHPDGSVDSSLVIENQVAAMQLVRSALIQNEASPVPEIYAWSERWQIEEFKDGVDLHATFFGLEKETKRIVLRQLARIVHCLQKLDLPETFEGFGGIGFDGSGNIVAKPMTTGVGGPFDSVTQLYAAMVRTQLSKSETSQLLSGWSLDDGLRGRLDNFLENGLSNLLGNMSQRPSFTHGDIGLQNVIFDPQTYSVTGLFNFRLSHVASSLDEFFYSFYDIGGILPGPYGESTQQTSLRNAILKGFPGTLPETTRNERAIPQFGTETNIQWDVAKLWSEEMEGNIQPRTLDGADEASQVFWFSEKICPFYVLQARWLASRTELQLQQEKNGCRKVLQQYLDRWGF